MSDSPPKTTAQFRKAGFEDVEHIVGLIRDLHSKVEPEAYRIPYHRESTLCMVDDVIRRGVCLVGPTSCAGAMLVTFPSNVSAVVASIIFWHFQRPREIAIFNALAEACMKVGATHLNASSHFPDNRIGRFYERCGLWASETQYLGRIEKACAVAGRGVRAGK